MSTFSEIELQVMWNRLIAVVEEQAQVLLRTAFSPIVREAGDLSAGIFDRQGNMLAQAITGTPGHVNSMAESVKHFIRAFPVETMQPGDIYITNDPWMGTGHLNDFVLTTPAFHRGRLVGLFSCTSHLMDIGGIGFGPDGTDVFMEGLYIPLLKLADARQAQRDADGDDPRQHAPADRHRGRRLLARGLQRCRLPAALRDDGRVRPQGYRRAVRAHHDALRGRRCCRPSRRCRKGTWSNTMTVDGYDEPLTLACYRGGLRQGHPCGLRRHGAGRAARHQRAARLHHGLHGVRARLHRRQGHPEQCRLAFPPHGLGAARARSSTPRSRRRWPRATSSARCCPTWCSARCARPIPDRVPAEGTSCLWNLNVRGETEDAGLGNYGFTHGGHLQRRHRRPADEGRALGHRLSLRREGHAGGDRGVDHAAHLLAQGAARRIPAEQGARAAVSASASRSAAASASPFELLAAYDRIDHPPRGRDGGKDGAAGVVALKSGKKLKGKGFQLIPPDDRLVVMTPGGGGIGAPRSRARKAVEADLTDGLISPTAAGKVYGQTNGKLGSPRTSGKRPKRA